MENNDYCYFMLMLKTLRSCGISGAIWRLTEVQLEKDAEMIWDTFRSFWQDELLKTMNRRGVHWIQAISQCCCLNGQDIAHGH